MENKECIICGGNDYNWGFLTDNRSIRFIEEDSKKILGIMPQKYHLHARKCNVCGNIQIFTVNKNGAEKKSVI